MSTSRLAGRTALITGAGAGIGAAAASIFSREGAAVLMVALAAASVPIGLVAITHRLQALSLLQDAGANASEAMQALDFHQAAPAEQDGVELTRLDVLVERDAANADRLGEPGQPHRTPSPHSEPHRKAPS